MKKTIFDRLLAARFGMLVVLWNVVLLEIFLRLFSPFPLNAEVGNIIFHPQLSHVMDTRFPDIDAAGFRNPAVLAQADIVAVGDSFTYGYNATMADTWPMTLGRLSKLSVYNFGIGGYGPLQYAKLVERAVALHPRFVLVGIHVPNDVIDVCTIIAELAYWREWASAQGFDPVLCGTPDPQNALTLSAPPPDLGFVRRAKTLLKKVAIVSAIDTLVWDPYKDIMNRVPGEGTVLFKDGRNDTYITKGLNDYNIKNTDTSKQPISMGADILEFVFRDMNNQVRAAGASFIVVFIPSRQSVMSDYLKRGGQNLPPSYLHSLDLEYAMENRFKAAFDAAGIRWVDSREELKRTVDMRANVYPFRNDNHPLAPGYDAIARTVLPMIAGAH